MQLQGRTIALYGRFSAGRRDRLASEVARAGGSVVRDLTRRSDLLVVGAQATALLASGALGARIEGARARGLEICGERAFAARLAGEEHGLPPTFPLAKALAQSGLSRADAEILAAFDLVRLGEDLCGFGDVATLKTCAELCVAGCDLARAVRILIEARARAPLGRHQVTIAPDGRPALRWDDGLTTLDGQGMLPLGDPADAVEDLFEAAMLAEAEEDYDEAARLYEQSARADREDPIAFYNCGNIRLRQGRCEDAVFAYRRAIERDPGFVEARYNLSLALETLGRAGEAAVELARALEADPDHADALFNLAQLRMKDGDLKSARGLYERFLALGPSADWAEKARRAIAYCRAAG